MKKILIVFSVFLLTLCLPVSVNAAQWVDGLCIKAVDGYAEIIDASPDLEGDIVIPDYYGGYGIEYIGVEAFKDCTGITSITLGENIGGIYYNAFAGCTNLTTVNFGAKSFSAKYSAGSPERPVFADCPNLTTVNIGKNVESIPKYLFYGVSSLKTVNFEGEVPIIGADAFKGCSVDLRPAESSTTSVSSKKPMSAVSPSSSDITSGIDSPSSQTTSIKTPNNTSSFDLGAESGGMNLWLLIGIAACTLIVLAAVAVVLIKSFKSDKQ